MHRPQLDAEWVIIDRGDSSLVKIINESLDSTPDQERRRYDNLFNNRSELRLEDVEGMFNLAHKLYQQGSTSREREVVELAYEVVFENNKGSRNKWRKLESEAAFRLARVYFCDREFARAYEILEKVKHNNLKVINLKGRVRLAQYMTGKKRILDRQTFSYLDEAIGLLKSVVGRVQEGSTIDVGMVYKDLGVMYGEKSRNGSKGMSLAISAYAFRRAQEHGVKCVAKLMGRYCRQRDLQSGLALNAKLVGF